MTMEENKEEATNIATTQEDSVETAETINLSQASVGTIEAELVRMSQSSAGQINATEVEVRQSISLQVEAENITLHQGGAGMIRSEHLEMSQGGFAIGVANEAVIRDSSVGALYTEHSEVAHSMAGVLVTRQVTGDHNRTVFMLAGRVDGSVETVLDTPRAMLAGLVAGVAVGMVLFVGSLLRDRRR